MQLVSAPDCGSGYHGFESGYPPFSLNIPTGRAVSDMKSSMGYRQAVRHRTLTPAFVGSNPTSPVLYGRVAQVVEHLTFNQVVRGSNPRTLIRTSDCLFYFFLSKKKIKENKRMWRNWQTRQI